MYGGPAMQPAAANYGGYGLEQGGFEENMNGAYGAVAPVKQPPTRRRATNLASILACLLVPTAVFFAVYSLQSFSPGSKVLCFLVLALVLLLAVPALNAWRRRGDSPVDPKWATFMLATALVAWTCAYFFGQQNYVSNIQPYKDIMSLNIYYDIDPSTATSQQLMDAGQIYFASGAQLDISKSMGFKNLVTYCVAPVTAPSTSNASSPGYDFWAVGINCCSGSGPDFACGEYQNRKANAGLRLMKEADKAYFQLAVKQATATYGIHTSQPFFLYWMQDPVLEIQAYQDTGHKYWIQGIGAFIGAQMLLVVIAAVVFSKMSP